MREIIRTGLLLLLVAPALAAGATIIVELDGEPAARTAARARAAGQDFDDAALEARRVALTAAQDAFLAELDRAGILYAMDRVEVTDFDGRVHVFPRRYTLVFNGLALEAGPGAREAIAAMPGVRAVHDDAPLRLTLDRSVDYIDAPPVYGALRELGPDDDVREGFEGQGIHVAVIDSGIDWSHPMFGGDPTPPRLGIQPYTAAVPSNEKVIYYLPLADGVIDDYGHGTHVSATAAGYLAWEPGADGLPLTGDDVPVHGVAPQARLMGYKACNASGTCLTTDILTALEDAVSPRTLTGQAKPVAHVINMSLGGSGGPDDSTSVAADNASLLGAIVVAAAGNDGPADRTLGSPGAARRAIAVAASNDPGVFPYRIDVLGHEAAPIRATLAPDSNATQPYDGSLVANYVFAGLADTPDQVPATVLGRICLVERGSTVEAGDQGTGLFGAKAAHCQAKGAIAVVVFNDEPGEIGAVLAPAAVPLFTITRADGLLLHQTIGYDADGISNAPLHLGVQDPELFAPGIAGFSSRGPVQGLGQVKPDVAAPGVDVLAATTMVGAPAASMQDASRYIAASGTSMATPHVAGAAALIKQAHPGWDADRIRALLINTATNPRDALQRPRPDGTATDRILEQGGGLIDVAEVVGAKAMMGVTGDGVDAPSILASHSFGLVPVINSRVTHVERVTAELRDLSGEGGTWDFAVADNRGLEIDGVAARIAPRSVQLSAGGAVAFTVELTVDGDTVREARTESGDELQLQWFVNARRRDGGESLRMPFYLAPIRSIPLEVRATLTEVYEGLVPAGDTGAGLAADVTYVDVPFEVDPAAFEIDATLEFITVAGVPDLDLVVLDPHGVEIGRAATEGGPERLTAPIVELGTYTYRVVGWANGPTPFTVESSQRLGGGAPALQPIEADWTGSDGVPVDFDGLISIAWTPVGGETAFEIERSTDGGASWQAIATVGGQAQSFRPARQPEGRQRYRVRGLFPARIGSFVTVPSDEVEVLIDQRKKQNITPDVTTGIDNVSFLAGVFAFDLRLTNDADRTWYPLAELAITRIKSGTGTVKVANADNGGSGQSSQNPAVFDYSHQLGGDDAFSPGETSAPRGLRFLDPAGELFTFTAVVTAYRQLGAAPPAGDSAGDEEAPVVGSSRVDLQACKLEYSIVSPK